MMMMMMMMMCTEQALKKTGCGKQHSEPNLCIQLKKIMKDRVTMVKDQTRCLTKFPFVFKTKTFIVMFQK